jgi:acyl-CoA reductase-like NAD-dependent aldehyde dehydrogenase
MTATAESRDTKVETRLFIGGEFVEAAAGRRFTVIEPATGLELAHVCEGRDEDIDSAVRAAARALGPWQAMAPAERARILRGVAELIDSEREPLARLEARDSGKPVAEARSRLQGVVAWFEFFADIALKLRSAVVPAVPGYLNYTLRQPLGVVGAIIPWNYPSQSCAIKIAAAVGVGNAIVLKPAEQAPLVPLAIARLCREAGVPPGVVNVVPGFGETAGRALAEHPGVAGISFTGSTEVGREVASVAGRSLKKVTLELGGKAPNVVFADADLDLAARSAFFTFTINQGQVCTAGTRLLVQQEVHDELVDRLVSAADHLRIGDPLDEETEVGALLDDRQLERVRSFVEQGVATGAQLACGGTAPAISGFEQGFFYSPTVFLGVRTEMAIAQQEIFGPVLSVIPFEDEREAIGLANDVLYGLSAGVWTENLARAHRVAAAIEAGIVWVNTMHVLSPASPISGWKQSGVGTEGGFEQAEGMTRVKSVWVNVGGPVPQHVGLHERLDSAVAR